MVFGIGRLIQHDAEFAIQPLLDAFQRFGGLTILHADACHDTHSLGLNEDLSFLAGLAAHGIGVGIVSTNKPFAVPSGGFYNLHHLSDFLFYRSSFHA